MTAPIDSYRSLRLDKAKRLRVMGFDPYPSTSGRTHDAGSITADFNALHETKVVVAGRVMSWRSHRGLAFADLQDQSGRIQIMLTESGLPMTNVRAPTLGFSDCEQLVDIGDIVEINGTVIRTRRGEPSVLAASLVVLAKALRPLPDKWNKITDEQVLVRRRYLDMIMNPEKREKFKVVSDIQYAIHSFLRDNDFIEFNTPVLQPIYGGGKAKPFKTFLNALSSDYFLAISHELYLKRLIIAGFERVYTIGRYFRNEGIDRTHNPEFSMLETMTAFQGYEYNMDLMEKMYRHLASNVIRSRDFLARGKSIDLMADWTRASMVDLVYKEIGVDFRRVDDVAEANEVASQQGADAGPTVGHVLANIFDARVAPSLIQPTIVYGHPVEISPLAKAMSDDPRYVERFELYIAGTEQGDNWSELNDPVELQRRFDLEQERRGQDADDEAHPLDDEFVEAMEYGMPPTTGVGPGMERLAMLLTDSDAISDVAFFPLLRTLKRADDPRQQS